MIRLLLLFLSVFIISLISFAVVYASVTITMFWLAEEIGFFTTPVQFNNDFLKAFFANTTIPAVMFASIVTGMTCIILYRAIQKKQRLQIGHLLTIFKSYLFLTVLFLVGFYIIIIMLLTSGRTGILQFIAYLKYIGNFFNYGMPLMWIVIAWYWIKKYESKFINDEEEWMLR